MSKLLKKFSGGTVLEVVVALIIISIAFGLTGTLFSYTLGSSKRMVKIQTWYDMNVHINRIKNNCSIDSLEIEKGHYHLRTEFELLDEETGLTYVEVSSHDKQGGLIAQRRFYLNLGTLE